MRTKYKRMFHHLALCNRLSPAIPQICLNYQPNTLSSALFPTRCYSVPSPITYNSFKIDDHFIKGGRIQMDINPLCSLDIKFI